MREVFKGWRRKIGCVALVIACALTAAWIRSQDTFDGLEIWIGNRSHVIASIRSGVVWFAEDSTSGHRKDEWTVESHSAYEMGYHKRSLDEIVERWSQIAEIIGASNHRAWVVQYWSLVFPPTLLSAYLLLWNPRKAK